MLLIKLRRARRTKPKLRDKQPKQRMLAKLRKSRQAEPGEDSDCFGPERGEREVREEQATQAAALQSSKTAEYCKGAAREIPAGETDPRKPKLARPAIHRVPQLQIRVARSELVARSLP